MTDDTVADVELREQLQALDPAATLPPADPAGVQQLVRDITNDGLDADLPETRQTGVHERSRLTWLVAAAAIVLIAGVSALVLLQRDGGDPPAADAPADQGPTGGSRGSEARTVTTLNAPTQPGAGRCAVPTPEILSQQALAFDGVVTGLSDEMVTLAPTVFYAGEPTDVVQVQAPPEVLEELVASVRFEVGQRYLVSALDEQVSVCGFSGAWSPGLERLYVEAFRG